MTDKESAAEIKRKLLDQKACSECKEDIPVKDTVAGDSYTDFRDVCYSCYGRILSRVYGRQGRQYGQ